MYTQKDAGKQSASPGTAEVQDLIHSFLIIMLQYSMRQKDGWKVFFFFFLILYHINIFSPCFSSSFVTSPSFYRILRLQFIVQSGSLLLVGLALERNE